jgi:hypothetical protein
MCVICMTNLPLEKYPRPDKTKTPSISSEFTKRRQFRTRSPLIDNSIASQVSIVSKNNIERYIQDLSSFQNRHSKSKYIGKVADWLKVKLNSFGYSNNAAYYHKYEQDGHKLKNVVCHKKGQTNKTILLCAHYDTILKENFEDAVSKAPGANDNASGVSAIIEIARILYQMKLHRNIQFVFFSGEEQGLWGSTHYSQYLKDSNTELELVVNMDMCAETGFLTSRKTTNIDVDNGQTGVVPENNQESMEFGQEMEQSAKDYTDLEVEFDPIDASDYMPFEARGYVCVGAYDGSAKPDNPHYHSSTDKLSNLDLDFLTSVTKMVLAFVLKQGHVIDTK